MSMMTLVGCSGLATGSGNVEKDEAKSEATLESMEIKTANDALERLKKGNEQYVLNQIRGYLQENLMNYL